MQGVNRFIAFIAASAAVVSAFGCSSSPMDTGGNGSDVSGSGGSGNGSGGSPAFPTTALSTFMTSDQSIKIELRTSPDQPIHVGPNNQGELRITDAATGAPVDDLSIRISTWMPVMRHQCSEVPVKVTGLGNGSYLLNPLVASMTGECELTLAITAPLADGGQSGKISVTTPTFTVAQ